MNQSKFARVSAILLVSVAAWDESYGTRTRNSISERTARRLTEARPEARENCLPMKTFPFIGERLAFNKTMCGRRPIRFPPHSFNCSTPEKCNSLNGPRHGFSVARRHSLINFSGCMNGAEQGKVGTINLFPPRTGSLSTLQLPVASKRINLVDHLAATRMATLLPAIHYGRWQRLDQVSIYTNRMPKIDEMNPAGSMEARRAKLAANSSNFQEVSHTSLTVIVQRLTIDSSLRSAWSFQIFLGTQC